MVEKVKVGTRKNGFKWFGCSWHKIYKTGVRSSGAAVGHPNTIYLPAQFRQTSREGGTGLKNLNCFSLCSALP